ncbi:MAG TPA: site-specific integrase [Gammaproteobacteria bacterium]|nr:site-specific integrase [Gammaproteobacteria bacterium]
MAKRRDVSEPPAHRRRPTRRHVRGAHRFRRGRRWYAYLPGEGRFALGTDDEATADRLFRARLAAHVERKARLAAEKTLDVIAEQYSLAPHGWTRRSRKSTKLRAAAFVEAMATQGITLPSQLTTTALDAWRAARAKKRAAATINRDEDVVRKMLRWAAEQTPPLCAPMPVAKRPRMREIERQGRQLIPSPAEVARLVAALVPLHHGLGLAVTVAVATGLRLDELRHLSLSAADLHEGVVRVQPERGAADGAWTSKGHRERRIPVGRSVMDLVADFVRWRDEHRWKLADSHTGRLLAAAAKTAGVEISGMHDLRRTFVTEAVRAGVPLTQVQDWVGHRDIRTTQRYLGRYRSDASVVAPAPAALAILAARPADVISLTANVR